ncbi:ABC transporter permease [Dactylosporangium siamense]|uniref:Uncharacterized protein n=1 Tax=Dactylosporangium siamense TaxID=685454 RepID=A0A919PRD6_9ACTN|nr:ABC transporter permease [Dactylosporangium siamense]GIG48332.1 hypothetical protein Dsi01nite_063730 [Dactylosporangium siamense]
MNRVLAVARLQAVGRRDGLLWPLVILGIAFAVNLFVFGSMGDEIGDRPVTGGLASVYITGLAFGAVAVAQQFPFALGLSVTRREFAIALGLFTLAQTAIYAVLLVVLQAVEHATDGWGLRLRFFGLGLIDGYGVPTQLLIYGAPMLLMSLIGITLGTVYVRWRTNGVFGGICAVVLVLGLAAGLVTKYGRWPAVGDWLADQSALSLFAGWPSLVAVLLALLSWTALRRATP